MKKKVLFVLCTMVISFIGMFSMGTNQASAHTNSFQTDDGKWDGVAYPTSSNPDVRVHVYDMYMWGTGVTNLSVRLCNAANTSACTGWKNFLFSQRAYFDGMKPGTYRVDIKDNSSSGYITGKLTTTEGWF